MNSPCTCITVKSRIKAGFAYKHIADRSLKIKRVKCIISLSRVEAWLLCKRGSGRLRVHALCTVHSKTAAIPVVSGRSTRVARRSVNTSLAKNISGAYKHGLHTSLVCINA